MKRCLLTAVIALSSTACTWVTLTAEGEQVKVLAADEVLACVKKGQTAVSLKADIASIERNAEKVQTELETLARNSAVELGGDSVVPVSAVDNGRQEFAVYRCRQS